MSSNRISIFLWLILIVTAHGCKNTIHVTLKSSFESNQVEHHPIPSALNSSISVSSTAVADNVDQATVTITLKDADGLAVKGNIPTFRATDTSGTNVYGICSKTDSAGISHCTLKSTKAEVKTVELLAPVNVIGNTVIFKAGPPAKITFTQSPSLNVLRGQVFIHQPQVTLHDAYDNIADSSNYTVTLQAHSNSTCTSPTGVLLANDTGVSTSGLITFTNVSYAISDFIYIKATSGAANGCTGLVNVIAPSVLSLANQTSHLVLGPTDRRVWGKNNSYYVGANFGDGTSTESSNSSLPLMMTNLSNLVQVTSGYETVFALHSDGTVSSWGWGDYGHRARAIGDGYWPDLTLITNAIDVQGAFGHSCALIDNGQIKCWGNADYGKLGEASSTNTSTPVVVTGVSSALGITVGGGFSCAHLLDGTVRCWGDNEYHTLGNGLSASSDVVVTPIGVSDVKSMTAGYEHVCAVLTNKTVMCWGQNNFGQLGQGHTSSEDFPIIVPGLANVEKIASGSQANHTCALLTDGTVKCWGSNRYGQIGNGNSTDQTSPVLVSGLSNVADIKVNGHFSCAVLMDNSIKCWGRNNYGQLGNNRSLSSTSKVTVANVNNAVELVSGYNFNCAKISDGTVKCWGEGDYGELGNGILSDSSSAVTVSGLTSVIELEANSGMACATFTSGDPVVDPLLKCWGDANPVFGKGYSTGVESSPYIVPGISNINQISLGHEHICAIKNDRTLWCWGFNWNGQLGDGTDTSRASVIQSTAIAGPVAGVASGGSHTCAIRDDGADTNDGMGSVWCWGWNFYGQLGDGTFTNSFVGVRVGTITDAVKVYATIDSSCAKLSNGTLTCWGRGSNGRLGTGSSNGYEAVPAPVLVSDVGSLGAFNQSHSCAIVGAAKNLECWGFNEFGHLGDGTTTDTAIPVSAGISGVLSVSGGGYHTCAILADSTVNCWGQDNFGQLGRQNPIYEYLPVSVFGF